MRLTSSLGQLPGTWFTLVIIIMAGLSEGFGIILFAPLLELMTDGATDAVQWPFSLVPDLFAGAGWPVSLPYLLGAISLFILVSLGLGYTANYLLVRAQHTYTLEARDRITRDLFHASWDYVSRQSHGKVFNKLITETFRAGGALRFEVLAVAAMVQIAIFIVFSSVLSWQLMAVTMVFGGLVVAVVRPFHHRARRLGDATTEANQNLSFHGIDILKGSKLIKVTANEGAVTANLKGHIRALFAANFLSEVTLTQVYFIVQALPVLLLAAIILISNEMLGLSPSSTLVFLLFLARIAPRVAQFQQHSQGYTIYCPSLTILDETFVESAAAREDTNPGGAKFEKLADGIEIEGLSFGYSEPGKPVLKDIDISIGKNQMVAIVGKSGVGKSTLIDLITGLRLPDSGRILVDGTDLAGIDLHSWRRRIGYVTQDIVVFNDTVRNNLLFSHPEAGEEEIERSIRLAHFREVVDELPDGLETVLGESGVRLSGGQKQRLSLARALVGSPEILLLDEATSALDNESERLIQDAIKSISHTMTIVVIAHRLSTVRKADVIYVMEQGRVVEQGSYEELLGQGGRFKELHELQFA